MWKHEVQFCGANTFVVREIFTENKSVLGPRNPDKVRHIECKTAGSR